VPANVAHGGRYRRLWRQASDLRQEKSRLVGDKSSLRRWRESVRVGIIDPTAVAGDQSGPCGCAVEVPPVQVDTVRHHAKHLWQSIPLAPKHCCGAHIQLHQEHLHIVLL
jgi:hypothetical protein